MPITSAEVRSGGCPTVTLDGAVYMFIEHGGKRSLVPSSCPHRGGPLHLGKDEGDHIECPWHNTRYRKDLLSRKALPFVRVGHRVHVSMGEPR